MMTELRMAAMERRVAYAIRVAGLALGVALVAFWRAL